MGDHAGVDVDIRRLLKLVPSLMFQANDLKRAAGSLSGVVADTGRPDSDQMGHFGPDEIGGAVRVVADALVTDAGSVSACAKGYSDSDSRAGQAFQAITVGG